MSEMSIVETTLAKPLPRDLVKPLEELPSAADALKAAKAAFNAMELAAAHGAVGLPRETSMRDEVALRRREFSNVCQALEEALAPLEEHWRAIADDQLVQGARLIVQAEHLLNALDGKADVQSTFVYPRTDGSVFRGERVPPNSTALMLGHFIRMARGPEE